jgi:SPP1 family phage portal protein
MIEDHQPTHDKTVQLYDRYKARNIPIFKRQPAKFNDVKGINRLDVKVNNHLNNAFDSDIVDTQVGYGFGHPIAYSVASDDKGKSLIPELDAKIDEFNKRNNVEDADSESGKKAIICGYSARLLYINDDGDESLMNVDPFEAIILSRTNDLTNPTYALRYYPILRWNGTTKETFIRADFYDGENITTFISSGTPDSGIETFTLEEEAHPHMFRGCPLFGIPNNQELQGAVEKVINLIDAYDRTVSDENNEIEQMRLAYLVIKNAGISEEDAKKIDESGIFELFEKDDDVKFLTKDINDAVIEHHLDRLAENIQRFAKTVNFSDATFGTTSGVALRYKLLSLENKMVTLERKFIAALRYQYKLLCNCWSNRKVDGVEPTAGNSDYLNIKFQFTRNLPVNLLEEAQTTALFKGNIPEKARLSLLSFITDVQQALDDMHADQLEESNMYDDVAPKPELPKNDPKGNKEGND